MISEFEIKCRIVNNVCVLQLIGDAVDNIEDDLKKYIAEYQETGIRNFIYEMSEVAYMNSTALGAVVATLKNVRDNEGDIKIASLSKGVKSLFEITRLDKIFEIFETETEAIESYEG